MTFGERVAFLIKEMGITKTAFANRLNVSQAFVSQICSDTKTPSDRTIADICREFNVNEEWLRTGQGDMLVNLDKQKKIAAFLGDLMHEEDSSFKIQLIEMLSEMGPDEWALLEKMARRLTGQ